MAKNATPMLLAATLLTGCIAQYLVTPHPQDAAAPTDTVRQLRGAGNHPRCARQVQMLPAGVGAPRPFRSIASISATCSPGTPSVCEQHLRERACQLQGDAVMLSDEVDGAAPSTGSTRALVARAGKVVRWLDAAQ